MHSCNQKSDTRDKFSCFYSINYKAVKEDIRKILCCMKRLYKIPYKYFFKLWALTTTLIMYSNMQKGII